MPKYRDKIRLKRRGEVDDFTRYLILVGYSGAVVSVGLAYFVECWEDTVKEIEKFGSDCWEEFDHDLCSRDSLHRVLGHAPEELVAEFMPRIEAADEKFKSFTRENVYSAATGKAQDYDALWWRKRCPWIK